MSSRFSFQLLPVDRLACIRDGMKIIAVRQKYMVCGSLMNEQLLPLWLYKVAVR